MKKSIVIGLFILFVRLMLANSAIAQSKGKDSSANKTVKVVPNMTVTEPVRTKVDTTKRKVRKIFEVFDEEPRFKDGDEAAFISEYLHYPKTALDNGIEGTVVLSVVIGLDGKMSDLRVLSRVPMGCTEESIRVIQLMDGKWIPGKINGQPVEGKKLFAIKFTIPKDVPKPKN